MGGGGGVRVSAKGNESNVAQRGLGRGGGGREGGLCLGQGDKG